MLIDNVKVMNFDNALRGMRNPKNSWQRSDSYFGIGSVEDVNRLVKTVSEDYRLSGMDSGTLAKSAVISSTDRYCEYAIIGPKDMKLAQSLIKGGSVHRKFLRQIFVTMDITAPLYVWKEADTYKVATVANSCSTMHTLANAPITLDLFETDDFAPGLTLVDDVDIGLRASCFIDDLEQLRQLHLHYKDLALKTKGEEQKKNEELSKKYWKELIRWLPESFLQKRTFSCNYETLINIVEWRGNHKLTEWHYICDRIKELPYAEEFIYYSLK